MKGFNGQGMIISDLDGFYIQKSLDSFVESIAFFFNQTFEAGFYRLGRQGQTIVKNNIVPQPDFPGDRRQIVNPPGQPGDQFHVKVQGKQGLCNAGLAGIPPVGPLGRIKVRSRRAKGFGNGEGLCSKRRGCPQTKNQTKKQTKSGPAGPG